MRINKHSLKVQSCWLFFSIGEQPTSTLQSSGQEHTSYFARKTKKKKKFLSAFHRAICQKAPGQGIIPPHAPIQVSSESFLLQLLTVMLPVWSLNGNISSTRQLVRKQTVLLHPRFPKSDTLGMSWVICILIGPLDKSEASSSLSCS